MADRVTSRPQYRIGCSGWIYNHWRGLFYPAKMPARQWFEHYAREFDTVEINNTFYRLPEADVFDAWRLQAPKEFIYAVKASRFLTHHKKLKDPAEPLERLFSRARHLGKHLGPVLYQLPPNWKPDVGRLASFCAMLPPDATHVFEFRSPEWLAEDVLDVLRAHKVCLCIHDLIPDHPRHLIGPIVYVRFHGATGKYSGCYSQDQMRAWADWLRSVAQPRRPVYAYFNNDIGGHAVENARMLRDLLSE